MNPRVTVLVPIYNGAAHFRAAIDSVLAQTFEDFELLLVDDASTDDSVAVVESYDDSRIRLLRNEHNLGQVPTTNRGLREARGEYVARLDQDDACLPRRLEHQVALLDAQPNVAVVGCGIEYVEPGGRIVSTLEPRIDDFPHFVFLLLANAVPLAHSAVMYRREEVTALGGYDESVRLVEDQDLWRRLALRRRDARVVPDILLRYLIHEGQQSRTHHEEQAANNKGSYMRFVETLADADAAAAAWRLETLDIDPPPDPHAFAAGLERVVAGASAKLDLSVGETAELDHNLRGHVGRMARRSWRADMRGAQALASWAGASSAERAQLWATRAAAPLLRSARKMRRYHAPHD
jgi:glycosyltransferase involved in cell wall biosynthesis